MNALASVWTYLSPWGRGWVRADDSPRKPRWQTHPPASPSCHWGADSMVNYGSHCMLTKPYFLSQQQECQCRIYVLWNGGASVVVVVVERSVTCKSACFKKKSQKAHIIDMALIQHLQQPFQGWFNVVSLLGSLHPHFYQPSIDDSNWLNGISTLMGQDGNMVAIPNYQKLNLSVIKVNK